eukprot:Gb_07688 [translate_table: standard]
MHASVGLTVGDGGGVRKGKQDRGKKYAGLGDKQGTQGVTARQSKEITKPAIRSLAHRGEVKCISGLIYKENRGVLKIFWKNIIREAARRWKKGLEAPLLVLDEAVDELHAGTDSVVANRKYAADEIGEASSAIRLRDGLLTCRPPVGSGCSSASGTEADETKFVSTAPVTMSIAAANANARMKPEFILIVFMTYMAIAVCIAEMKEIASSGAICAMVAIVLLRLVFAASLLYSIRLSGKIFPAMGRCLRTRIRMARISTSDWNEQVGDGGGGRKGKQDRGKKYADLGDKQGTQGVTARKSPSSRLGVLLTVEK